jgi:hypothetical protein
MRKLGAEGTRIIAWAGNTCHAITCVGLFFLMLYRLLGGHRREGGIGVHAQAT